MATLARRSAKGDAYEPERRRTPTDCRPSYQAPTKIRCRRQGTRCHQQDVGATARQDFLAFSPPPLGSGGARHIGVHDTHRY